MSDEARYWYLRPGLRRMEPGEYPAIVQSRAGVLPHRVRRAGLWHKNADYRHLGRSITVSMFCGQVQLHDSGRDWPPVTPGIVCMKCEQYASKTLGPSGRQPVNACELTDLDDNRWAGPCDQ